MKSFFFCQYPRRRGLGKRFSWRFRNADFRLCGRGLQGVVGYLQWMVGLLKRVPDSGGAKAFTWMR